jgi:hypothetical protein
MTVHEVAQLSHAFLTQYFVQPSWFDRKPGFARKPFAFVRAKDVQRQRLYWGQILPYTESDAPGCLFHQAARCPESPDDVQLFGRATQMARRSDNREDFF